MEFRRLEQLRRYAVDIIGRQSDSLRNYYVSPTSGFRRLLAAGKGTTTESPVASLTSTATCVVSLVVTGQWGANSWKADTLGVIRSVSQATWDSAGLGLNNVYAVAFALEAVTALASVLTETEAKAVLEEPAVAARVIEAERILEASLSESHGFVRVTDYAPSAYMTQLVVRVLQSRHKFDDNLGQIVRTQAWDEINRQLALLTADSKAADVFELIYSVMLASCLTKPGEATPQDNQILRAALGAFFAKQLPDGTWPLSRPLFHHTKTGSAYCHEYEMLAQLLTQPSLEDKLSRHFDDLEQAAYGLRETSFELPREGIGWSSGHHPETSGPESWSTGSVFHFLHALDRLVAGEMRRSLFDYLDTPRKSPQAPKSDYQEFAPRLLDCSVKVRNKTCSLRKTLFDHFVKPIAMEAFKVELGGSLSRSTPMSAILFGPPGTSKTELTKRIAEYLGWPLLNIDPSNFTRNGLDQVQAEADRIFGMLSTIERVVVLLDEFDEMVREREKANDVLSRFLTTAMLPKLATINEKRKIAFIVATNHIENFDLAISRPGRFDLILQVMPPRFKAKQGKWNFEPLVDVRSGQVDEQHKKQIAALTYAECEELAMLLGSAQNRSEAVGLLSHAYSKCTLMSPFGEDHEGHPINWEKRCIDQVKYIRVRGIPDAPVVDSDDESQMAFEFQ